MKEISEEYPSYLPAQVARVETLANMGQYTEESEEHHLAEARAALPLLATPCLVLFDDTRPSGDSDGSSVSVFWGKGARAIPFLIACGFQLEWAEEGQVLLSRGFA